MSTAAPAPLHAPAYGAFLARGFLAWLLIAALETLHGIARTLWLSPLLGDELARRVAVPGGVLIVSLVAWLTVRWIGARSTARLLAVGALWLLLMVGFDIVLAQSLGFSWERILADFDPRRGGLLGFGMATMLVMPWLAARLRGLR
jgi:hypothetical protein